jgi:predicted CoA-substrate-specific enzyme activase
VTGDRMKYLGIDIGSLTTKVVILDGNGVRCFNVEPSGEEPESSARAALEHSIQKARLNLDGDLRIVSTGIGGKLVSFPRQNKTITTCLARGVHFLFPSARMAIDLGAESATVLKVNERGRVNDWVNHDKCAAGTGVFLQQMAKLMQVPLDEMARISYNGDAVPDITSTCAVFAESEVISHVHRDPPTPKEAVVAGIYASVVSRIVTLCKRIGIEREVAVVGGVARNRGLIRMLERELGFGVLVPDEPQTAAALGAAIIARESLEKSAA